METGIDFLDQTRLGFDSRLLIAAFLQALDFKAQARILAVNGSQNFAIVERVTVQALLFVEMGTGYDGIYQVAFILHEAQRPLEVRFIGMQVERFAKDADTFVEVGLVFYPAIHGGDESGEILALMFLNVVLECLKNGVVGVFGQVGFASSPGFGKVVLREMLARLGVSGVHRIVLGADLVVEALVVRAALAIDRVGSFAVEFQDYA